MRARHIAHSLPSFPVYSSAFVDNDLLVLGGGGGASRTGIKNKLRLYHVDEAMKLKLMNEFELERGEDAPMSMAAHLESKTIICGVNSTAEKIQSGQNENCRLYNVKDDKLSLIGTQGTLSSGDVDDYQKVTVLSPNATLAFIAGKQNFSLIAYPSLTPISPPMSLDKDEIYDASFSSSTLLVATTTKLLVYSLPKSAYSDQKTYPPTNKKGKQKARPLEDIELLKIVGTPAQVGGAGGCTFRAAKLHPRTEKVFYTATNTVSPPTRNRKSVPPKSHICKWDSETWSVTKVRQVGDRPLTCFDISSDGKLLAYGLSNYSIGLLDGSNLAPLLTILRAHEFPPTTIRFNPAGTLLISASPDNTVRTVVVPSPSSGQLSSFSMAILVVVIAIILGFALQYFMIPAYDLEP